MPANAYDQLCDHVREVSLLTSTESTLSWDQETYMPAKALAFRARQMSWLSGKAHAQATGRMMQKLLVQASESKLNDAKQAANVRVMTEEHERNAKIPNRLVIEESELTAHAKHAWVEARKKSDFSGFAPHLEKLLGIARRKADLWGYADEPYDALLHTYERGTRTREVAALFSKLKPELTEIARAAVARGKRVKPNLLRGNYPVAKQQQLNAEIAASIGFDFEAGRIDTTAHPFCTTLGPRDIRLTTRYDEKDFTSSLFGVLHESGHGLYEQGLPEDDFGLPSGRACSLGIHESQSRLWENHVGRSTSFWQKWLPRAAEIFPNLRKIKLEDFMATINRSEYSFIRVEADEATYDLHILLRFEIERRMVNGDLPVADVPEAWNALFTEMFGMTPPDAAHGCLQDIHWSMGGLGYFATYTLGNLNAAQLFATARKQKRIAAGIEKADYAPLLAWLRNNVHSLGGATLPGDIMQHATGKATDARHHLKHLRERFVG
ncbi:carboxypeptidase M32 [Brevifollis gellanilyticus]|uniref:Metal-dependent carboxypeptidase n=1 Tax=Brevifollis gellanilyticus TaxID=748831 RepID=A0A512MG30_9BACT|nr:carboxypeptidase M32 [Brevifollis gellanilyticus]GEP45695.1 carboxypeptidase M32 [Brevifollis gellanilyticus]